jgi:ornithine cyclodeaminase/alanine dehydrogenase-like protein (mu-crystallin family)
MTAGPIAGVESALLLTRRDIAALMDPAAWLDAVETGFRAGAAGRANAPPPLSLPGIGGSFHAKAATIALDRDYAALKLNANFPGNPRDHGLPTIQGALLLHDGRIGTLLAIMDSIAVTLGRTAGATALAARHLARPDARTLLLCGCGEQAPAQLAALRAVLPLERVMLWDADDDRARRRPRRCGAAQRCHRHLHQRPCAVSRRDDGRAGHVHRRGRRGQSRQERDRARTDGARHRGHRRDRAMRRDG